MIDPLNFPTTPIVDALNDPSQPQTLQVYNPAVWQRTLSYGANNGMNTTPTPGQAVCNGCGPGTRQWNFWLPSYGLDHECYETIAVASAAAPSFRVYARAGNPFQFTGQPNNGNAYYMSIRTDTGAWTLIARYSPDSGSVAVETTIGSGTQAAAVGDSIGIRVQGTTIIGYFKPSGGAWAVLANVTDNTVTAMGYIVFSVAGTASAISSLGGGILSPTGALIPKSVTPAIGM